MRNTDNRQPTPSTEATIHRYGMVRPFGIGTFPKNEAVIGTDPKNDRRDSGYWDILLTSEPLSQKEIAAFELKDLEAGARGAK